MLSADGECELASIARFKCAWSKFRQLHSLLTNHHLFLLIRGRIYATFFRRAILQVAETWVVTLSTLNRLERNDLAMFRWMRNVRASDNVFSDPLPPKLGIQNVEVVLHNSRMRWFGHVERSARFGYYQQSKKHITLTWS